MEPWQFYQRSGETGPWSQFQQPQEAPQSPVKHGMILPIYRDDKGVHFSTDEGLIGSVKRAVQYPGQVMRGEVDPLSNEGIGRNLEFSMLASPANPAIRSGEKVIPGVARDMRKPRIEPPTTQQLYDAGGAAFNRMRDTNVDYSSAAVKKVAEALKAKLEEKGLNAEVAKKTHRVLDQLASPPEGSVANIRGIHSARKTFGEVAQNFNKPSDQKAASEVIRGLDDFIGAGSPESVVAGSAPAASAALKEGNANWAAASRSDLIHGIDRASELRANAANSGANTGNTIRSRVASALLQPKKTSGFSPEEIALLEGINKGSPAANSTRYIGNLLGGGGGLGQMLTTAAGAGGGYAAFGPGGAMIGSTLPTAVGVASKKASNLLTERALRAADEAIRMRSPLYKQMESKVPYEAINPAKKAAVIRALLMSQTAPMNGGGGGY